MIQFNNNNRPTCNPQNKAECDVNNAALQDVWDALACLSEQYVITGVKCFDFLQIFDQDTFFIDKEDIASIDSTCLINFFWNGVQYYTDEANNDDILKYTITERQNDFMITLNIIVGSEDEPCDVRITVFEKKKVLDMFNACEEKENCRD